MVDHQAMREAVHRATHLERCTCLIQQRIQQYTIGRNATDVDPIIDVLLERIEQLESALDEVGHALTAIVGDSENNWGQKFVDEGTAILLDIAAETFEYVRRAD